MVSQLDSCYQREQAKKKEYVGTLFDFILYFARQGVSIRGHRESKQQKSQNRGNFLELCDLYAKRNEPFKEIYDKYHNYTSHDIQKEMISSLSNEVLSKIIKEVKEAGMFALMLDEARCHKEQQLSFCIRYCTDDEIKERFLGFINVSNSRDATSLSDVVFEKLKDLGLDKLLIVAQTYDGANVMSGEKGGLQAKIRFVHHSAIYVHCYAHKLALVVRNTCDDVPSCRKFFNILESLYVHFAEPGSHHTLKSTIDLLGVKPFEITQLSDTRWICRFANCQKVVKQYQTIIEALEREIDDNSDLKSVTASGILTAMKKYDFIAHLVILTKILSTINMLSLKFQQEDMTLGKAAEFIRSTLRVLEEDRNNETHFDEIWKEIGNLCDIAGIQLIVPSASEVASSCSTAPKRKRPSKISSKLDDFVVTSTVGHKDDIIDDKKSCRIKVYNQIYDNVIRQFKSRFSDESLIIARAIDSFLDFNYNDALPFINYYKSSANIKINEDLLQAELKILKNVYSNLTPNGRVDPVKFIFENKKIAPNAYILAKISATIPISSATAERSFSGTYFKLTVTYKKASLLKLYLHKLCFCCS